MFYYFFGNGYVMVDFVVVYLEFEFYEVGENGG